MNSLTGFSTSGIRLVKGLCHSRSASRFRIGIFRTLTQRQDLVSGLDGVMFNDLMDNIEWFFNLHDKNKDEYLTRDEVLTLSESFLVSVTQLCFS